MTEEDGFRIDDRDVADADELPGLVAVLDRDVDVEVLELGYLLAVVVLRQNGARKSLLSLFLVLDGFAIDLNHLPEFVSRAVDQWAYEQGLQWHTIQPGRPMENSYIESFNGRFRDECLNENWFTDLADAREKIAAWKQDYNRARPHSALGYRTPEEFALQAKNFLRAGVGQEDSNAGPLPHTPIPATLRGEQNPEKVSLSLD